jgi:hypothetical protein
LNLWNADTEKQFFKEALKNFSSKEKIFCLLDNEYFAYIPKECNGNGETLQSRNSLIGQFTEKWTKDLFTDIAKEFSLYAINGVICEELSLTKRSSCDLALCVKNNTYQKPEDIKIIFEIKMSIVSNYKLINENNILYLGNYKTHKGNPSLLRSDSMLKAIGKAVNIRVSSLESSKIPIIVLGNSPIQESYIKKVDFLKNTGLVQGFWSLNPNPLFNDDNYIRNSPKMAFRTIETADDLYIQIKNILSSEFNYFSSMTSKNELGKIIFISSQEKTNKKRAEKFLSLIRGNSEGV